MSTAAEEEVYRAVALVDYDATEGTELSFRENDCIWITDSVENGFRGHLERTGAEGELRLTGGFRCLDIGNSTPQQRAQQRATLLREQYQQCVQQRREAQAALESLVVAQDTLRTADETLLLRFLPCTVPQLAQDCIQLALNAAALEEALRREQTCRIASVQTLRLLVDLVKELSLEDVSHTASSPLLITEAYPTTLLAPHQPMQLLTPLPSAMFDSAASPLPIVSYAALTSTSSASVSGMSSSSSGGNSGVSAAVCFERLENVRLKMSIAAPAVPEAATSIQNVVPQLMEFEHSLVRSQLQELELSQSSAAAPTTPLSSTAPSPLTFRPLRRRRADAVPTSISDTLEALATEPD